MDSTFYPWFLSECPWEVWVLLLGGGFVWEGGVRKEEGAAVALTPIEFITTQKSLLHRNEQTFGFPY